MNTKFAHDMQKRSVFIITKFQTLDTLGGTDMNEET